MARSSAVTPFSGVRSTLPEIDSARWSPDGSSSPTRAMLPLVVESTYPDDLSQALERLRDSYR